MKGAIVHDGAKNTPYGKSLKSPRLGMGPLYGKPRTHHHSSPPGRKNGGRPHFLMKLKQRLDGELNEAVRGAWESDYCLNLENVVYLRFPGCLTRVPKIGWKKCLRSRY